MNHENFNSQITFSAVFKYFFNLRYRDHRGPIISLKFRLFHIVGTLIYWFVKRRLVFHVFCANLSLLFRDAQLEDPPKYP